jgi:hypothetical protein
MLAMSQRHELERDLRRQRTAVRETLARDALDQENRDALGDAEVQVVLEDDEDPPSHPRIRLLFGGKWWHEVGSFCTCLTSGVALRLLYIVPTFRLRNWVSHLASVCV